MDQGTGDSTQGQSTPVTDTMDQGTGDSTQSKGQSTTVPAGFVIKLEPPWSMKEEPPDQPSAVYSTAQPMSDNTSGSLLSLDTKHACQLCSAVFMLSGSLQVHMGTFHGETQHSQLPVASRLHNSASEDADKKLEPPWTVKEEPQDEPSAVCSTEQPMSDNTAGSLLSLNTSHVCQRCSATFVLFSSLELHMVTFHGETPHDFFPMYSAYKSFDVGHHCGSMAENMCNCNQQGVKRRKEEVGNTDFDRTGLAPVNPDTCDSCGMAVSHTSHLQRHMKMHTGEPPYMYIDCEKGIAHISKSKDRQVTHTGEKPYVCTECGKRFVWSSSLKKHRLIHTGEKPHVCTDCGRGFTESGTLKSHQKTHTGEKPHMCADCGKAFAQLSSLKRHYLTHTDEKPYTCDVCGMAFAWTSQLTIHKRIHTGEEPFVCPDCGKGFAQSSHLKRHHLTHTGKKPYMCTVCGKGFAQPSHLKRHHLTHTGEEPYVCTHCGKGFAQSSNLKRHQLIHTGEKP